MILTQKQVRQKINEWRKILDIEKKWKITFDIHTDSSNMRPDCGDSMANIIVDSYFNADLEINSQTISNESELNTVILHELLHIILEPVASIARCGMGEQFKEVSIGTIENTIERLIPGYLSLYNKAYNKKRSKK